MKNSTTMLDFFKRKDSNSSKINVGLPTTNVAIPIPENVDAYFAISMIFGYLSWLIIY